MRIPKPVNDVLDWAERHAGPLAAVITLVVAAVAAMWVPMLAGFIIGLAFGGFAIHLRQGKRAARLRREVDDLLRENGLLRHRNNVLSSGIITREAQMTQALVSIPEDEPRAVADPQRTQMLPTLPDDEEAPASRSDEQGKDGGPAGDTADLDDADKNPSDTTDTTEATETTDAAADLEAPSGRSRAIDAWR